MEAYPWRDMTDTSSAASTPTARAAAIGAPISPTRLAKATYRQRITQFTEELPFLSEEDKDWVMGKAILERLKWA